MGATTAAPPLGRRVLLGAGLTLAVLLMLLMVLASLTGALSAGSDAQTGEFAPSAAAVADIPPQILPIYLQAGQSSGVDWAILAAIGKIETDHGRSTAKGVHSGVNAYGCCAGPMQFSVIGHPSTWGSYGVDGDHDGDKDVYDPADAIAAAAAYLKASGAPDDYNRAIFAYNHASWYVTEVLAQAQKYRGAAQDATAVPQLPGERANAHEILRLADGPHPRITLTDDSRNDVQTGQIDPRVTSLLVAIADQHTIVVTVLKTGHSYYTSSGNPSNHAFGRAADIGAVDGQACNSTTQSRTGRCWLLARQLAHITGPLHPTELIYGIDPDGPGPAFARGDHTDHIHAGYDT